MAILQRYRWLFAGMERTRRIGIAEIYFGYGENNEDNWKLAYSHLDRYKYEMGPKQQSSSDTREVQDLKSLMDERLGFEMLISDLSARFIQIKPRNVYEEISRAIKKVVDFFDLDRGSTGEFLEDGTLVVLARYAKPGIKSVDLKFTNKELPWYTKTLLAGEVINVSGPEDLPEEAMREYEYGKKLGIKSTLAVPITLQGKVICGLEFDSFRNSRTWPEDLVKRVRLLGEIFANALLRYRTEKELKKAFDKIKELNKKIESERDYLREEIDLQHNYGDIIGNSQALKYALYKIDQVAPTDTATLILGETGTGKELIARAIHNASSRRDSPLIKMNCAALPPNLIESELFGHEKGAFSGAHARRIGRFELADKGTIFLDEIGELPLDLQSKLLRVIQEGEFERLGSSRTIKVDARIIAATNRDLEKEVHRGQFRQDLWYRLNVYPITVPPLRERHGDIPLLVHWFISKFNKKMGKKIKMVTQKDMKMLEAYAWPGNVRELENIIERSVINTRGSVLNLSERLASAHSPNEPVLSLAANETALIKRALKQTKGKIYGADGAAVLLEISPENLRAKMKKRGIQKSMFEKR